VQKRACRQRGTDSAPGPAARQKTELIERSWYNVGQGAHGSYRRAGNSL
jgi:hypothetical protein